MSRSQSPKSGIPVDPAVLVQDLGSRDGERRSNARRLLEKIGHPSVAPLIDGLSDPNEQVRWGAAKALGNIGDGSAVDALAGAMADDSFDVRWMAAEGLARYGGDAVQPLLRVLSRRPDSPGLYRVAHYVVRTLSDEGYRQVLGTVEAALDDVEPAIQTPQAARAALDKYQAK